MEEVAGSKPAVPTNLETPPMNLITLLLPDGNSKQLAAGSTSLDLAKAISPNLAKVVVAALVNGQLADLQDPLPDQAQVQLIKADSKEGLDVLRHSCEHIFAAALMRLFQDVQITMGPKSHEGEFYYDFDIGRPVTPEDIAAIEKEMGKLIAQNIQFKKSVITKDEARALFQKLGQRYKQEILDWIPSDTVSIYESGDFIDLCRGPHLPHTGFIKAFKLLANSGSYWRADASREMLQRITGIAFASKADLDAYLFRIEEAKKRDHRKLGEALELFSVSERYDAHEFSAQDNVELLVTGSVRKDSWFDLGEEVIAGLKAIFEPQQVTMSGYSLSSHDLDKEHLFDVDVKIFTPPLTKEQRDSLEKLQKNLNEKRPGGRLKLSPETRFNEEIGPGLVTWLPKGARVRVLIEDLWRKMHLEGGYEMVFSPHVAKSDLWKVSGHWCFYKESMFPPMTVDGQQYVMKPMNCPFHVLVFKNHPRSYRDLPLRFAELGTVYRYELAGVMHGLMRVRGFTQDDAHLFCRWDQVNEEIDRVIGFILSLLRLFGFKHFEVNLSTRPTEYVGELDQWERAEAALEAAVKRHGLPYQVDAGGGAFYGPKIDIKLRDSLDRLWQCSTVQLDFNNPERFGLTFTNDQGKPEQPVMIHRALLGSLERFLGVLIEEHAGAFPMWLSPEQVRVLAIADRHLPYATKLGEALKQAGLRVSVPTASEKLGAKIRSAQLEKIPVMLVIGDQEMEKMGATVRLRTGEDKGFMDENSLVAYCVNAAQVPSI